MTEPAAAPLHVARRAPLAPDRSPLPFTLLFVHGVMDRASSFARVASRLPEATIVGYDRRGYGQSARGPSDRFDDHVADLFEVIGDEPVVALGHSFGGGVVLAAAARRPDLIRAAVVWEAPMPWMAWWPSRRPSDESGRSPDDTAEAFMRQAVGDRIWEHLPATTRAKRRSEGPALLADLRAIARGAPWDAAEVDVPVLVGTGTASKPHHVRAATELAATLPRGRGVTVDGAGHGAHLTHPVDLAELLRGASHLALTVGTGAGRGAESGVPAAPLGGRSEERP